MARVPRTRQRHVVALVSDAIYPYHCGGKELRYYELASRLAARADVHLYTMNWWTGCAPPSEQRFTYHALCRLRPLYSGQRRSIPQALFFALACLRLLWCDFDVIEADHMPYLHIPVLRLVTSLDASASSLLGTRCGGRPTGVSTLAGLETLRG